ncbi:MAG: hypothetical protein ACE5OZ_12225 [Candidatus Heimdallarchaeota archaeon]
MSIILQTRVSEEVGKQIDSLVRRKIYRSRSKAIEAFVMESLEKRGMIQFKGTEHEVSSEEAATSSNSA